MTNTVQIWQAKNPTFRPVSACPENLESSYKLVLTAQDRCYSDYDQDDKGYRDLLTEYQTVLCEVWYGRTQNIDRYQGFRSTSVGDIIVFVDSTGNVTDAYGVDCIGFNKLV